jgi:hypothetical protein
VVPVKAKKQAGEKAADKGPKPPKEAKPPKEEKKEEAKPAAAG